jgi:hypothetical protein
MPQSARSSEFPLYKYKALTGEDSLAVETLRYLGEQIDISTSTWRHPPPDSKEKEQVNMKFKLPYSTEQWKALSSGKH